jgi:hypothetical protein
MGNENSDPQLGARFESVETAEIKIEVTFEKHLESKILKASAIMFMKRWPTKFMN